jgi:serine/threonine-protein kinase
MKDPDPTATLTSPRAGPARASSDGLPAPGVIGEYRIERLLARGGFGAVHLATHLPTGRAVALKILREDVGWSSRAVERFAREIEVVRRLQHPDIVAVEGAGVLPDGRPFFAMEHLEGATLASVIVERGRLDVEASLAILEPVCAALGAAHRAGVVHRDVKPSNIFVCSGEGPSRVKLLDFGIAKVLDGAEMGASWLTSAGNPVGTISLMAPEQILCKSVDARTDVYALGATLYAMLAGALPFLASDDEELMRLHLEAPVPRVSRRAPVPPAVDGVILRAMEKSADRRFPSCASFLEALREAAGKADGGRRASVLAVGLLVWIRVRAESIDDQLAEDVGAVLDEAEATLRAEGYGLATSSDEILATRALSGDAAVARAEMAAARRLSAALCERLGARAQADARVTVGIVLHVDEAVVDGGAAVVGGAITQPGAWAVPGMAGEVTVTAQFKKRA